MMNNLKRVLLGTTCLTIVGALPAAATSFTESTDFSNTFAGANLLAGGTDTVNGFLECCGAEDYADFFTFQGLAAGDYVFALTTGSHSYDSSTADLYLLGSSSSAFSGILNGSQAFHLGESGNVTVGVNLSGESAAYTATLSAQSPTTPEPSTLLLGAAGLVGALAWRRRRPA